MRDEVRGMKRFLVALSAFLLLSCQSNNESAEDFSFIDDWNPQKYEIENLYSEKTEISLDESWTFASFSKIRSGKSFLYKSMNSNGKTVALNAGHGTEGGNLVKTFSHPDKSPKLTGGTTAKGSVESTAVSGGMTFKNGTSESEVNLRVAVILRKLLLENGYNVLMIRDEDDVQLDNIARTVIANNNADIHISIHFDGDNKNYDKGCFYCGIPDGLSEILENVKLHAQESERLGKFLVKGLEEQNLKIYKTGRQEVDLTQTSYSTIPTVDLELGNECTIFTAENLEKRAEGILNRINFYFDSDI